MHTDKAWRLDTDRGDAPRFLDAGYEHVVCLDIPTPISHGDREFEVLLDEPQAVNHDQEFSSQFQISETEGDTRR